SRSRTSLWSTPLNSQSTTPKDLVHHSGSLRDEGEEARRVQLVEVTIDSLAEVGYVGTTLAEIARRAGVSPGLVAHYFDDKDGLLEAAFRTLARTLAARMRRSEERRVGKEWRRRWSADQETRTGVGS